MAREVCQWRRRSAQELSSCTQRKRAIKVRMEPPCLFLIGGGNGQTIYPVDCRAPPAAPYCQPLCCCLSRALLPVRRAAVLRLRSRRGATGHVADTESTHVTVG